MLKGSIPAIITPFSKGEVDFDSFAKLLKWPVRGKKKRVYFAGEFVSGDISKRFLKFITLSWQSRHCFPQIYSQKDSSSGEQNEIWREKYF